MKYCIALIWVCCSLLSFGQQGTAVEKLVQVSGIITDADSNNVVPYVTVINMSSNKSIAANYKGYFSFIAHPGDTLAFTAVGYKGITKVIPITYTEAEYTVMVKLKAEVTFLQAVRIYPWATVEDFTRDFLSMKIADDDIELAKKNLNPENLRKLGVTLPRDAGEISNMNNRLEHDRLLNKNMVQTNPLLNPFAWGRLLQSIMKGDRSRAGN